MWKRWTVLAVYSIQTALAQQSSEENNNSTDSGVFQVSEEARSCFTESPVFGATEGTFFSDYNLMEQLASDHSMNSVRVCTDEYNKNVFGIRLTYSRYEEDGRLIEEKFLESHGTTEESGIVYCQTLDFLNGEYINSLGFGFTSTDLVQFLYRTNFETIGSYGSGATEGIIQTPLATFSDGGIMLFGL